MSEEKNCDKPDIRDSFKGKKCSEEQVIKCHGQIKLDEMKQKGEI